MEEAVVTLHSKLSPRATSLIYNGAEDCGLLALSPAFPADVVAPKCSTQPAKQSIGPSSLRQTQCVRPHFSVDRLGIGDPLIQILIAVGVEYQSLLVFCTLKQIEIIAIFYCSFHSPQAEIVLHSLK